MGKESTTLSVPLTMPQNFAAVNGKEYEIALTLRDCQGVQFGTPIPLRISA